MSPDEFLVMTCCLAWTVNSLHAVKLNTLYASYVRYGAPERTWCYDLLIRPDDLIICPDDLILTYSM